ncbi:hypothetical protein CANINC_004061 [Pichia inconspicua]|uniref:L-type lectin-like domain-containing protein n=1 Tax=Pichia inconspicua TaxID=52247 RepID=A0A4T0WX07_9ASCO|nr:hypothetical protein CANINC_004061 [[Candida] inconspicua]
MRITDSVIVLVITFASYVMAVNEIAQLSLANLVSIETLDDISVNWKVTDAAKYEEGRIILTPKSIIVSAQDESFEYGSLWSTKSPVSLESFTTELTIRSIGSVGYTDAGISLFIIDANNDVSDESNFGGPFLFKGLQVLLNHDRELGPVIRVYLNDGSKKLNIESDFIGAYKNEYQGATVPMTIKVAYSNNFFKITCDNKLLFVSDQINLDKLISNEIRIGITAQSRKKLDLHEQFEVLRLITYDDVTKEMKEDEDETLFAKHDQYLAQRIPIGDKFREQEARLISKLQDSKDVGGDSISKELSLIKDSMAILLEEVKLVDQTVIRQQIFTLGKSIERLSINFGQLQNQYDEVNRKLDEISNVFKKQFNLLDNYDSSLRAFDKVLRTQLKSADNLDNKISDLVTRYKNDDYNSNNNGVDEDFFTKLKSILYIILLPIKK